MPIKKKKAVSSEKRLYEIVALFPGEFAKKDEAKFLANIKKHLEDVGAEIQRIESWGERLLTYTLNGHDNACFIFSHFVLDSEQVAALTKDLRLDTEVLRSLITIVPHDYKLPETAELVKEFLGWSRQPIDAKEAEVSRDSYEKRSNRHRDNNNSKPGTSSAAPAGTTYTAPAKSAAAPVAAKKPAASLAQLDKKLDEILSK